MSEEKEPYGNKLTEQQLTIEEVAEQMAEKLTKSREIINKIFGELKEDADISAEYFSIMQDFFVGSRKLLEKFNKLKENESA